MTIYFINKKSKLKGPFDVTDAHFNKIIKIGDVCIRDTDCGLQFLLVVSNINRWSSCNCIGYSNVINHDIEANMLLFSFDGINRRKGDVSSLEFLSEAFAEGPLRSFILNALDILKYRQDFWDIQLFLDIHSSSPITIADEIRMKSITETDKRAPMFVNYFNSEMKNMFYELQAENLTMREIYTKSKELKPTDFRTAMRNFLMENPNSNIYKI